MAHRNSSCPYQRWWFSLIFHSWVYQRVSLISLILLQFYVLIFSLKNRPKLSIVPRAPIFFPVLCLLAHRLNGRCLPIQVTLGIMGVLYITPGKNWSMMRAFCGIWINLTTIWNDGEVSLAEASMEYVEGKATQKYGFSLQMSGNHLQMVIFQLPRNGERNWKLSQRVMTGVALGEVSDVLSDQGFRSRTGSIWRKRTLKHQNSNPNHQPSFFSYKYLYIYIYTYHYHCHYIYIYISLF